MFKSQTHLLSKYNCTSSKSLPLYDKLFILKQMYKKRKSRNLIYDRYVNQNSNTMVQIMELPIDVEQILLQCQLSLAFLHIHVHKELMITLIG
jgi:hypothetical protein